MSAHGPAPLLLALLTAAAPLAAQNNYFVNGLTGADQPGNGTSPSSPWKTLRYSYSQIPAAVFPNGHTLAVAGSQIYSPATNGEQFPLTPPANVATVGATVGRPILDLPAGATGFRLDPNTVYNRGQARIESLVFRGGNVAIELGGASGSRHRPGVLACEFQNQNSAAVQITTSAVNIDDPRFYSCRFRSQTRGISGIASGNSAILRPDIDECTFDNHADAGVVIEDRSLGGSDVGGLVRNCWFLQCPRGVLSYSGLNVQGTRLEIRQCFFKDSAVAGVDVQVNRPADPLVTVQGCAFVGGARAVRFAGFFAPGQYTLEAVGNYARGQSLVGFDYPLNGSGTVAIRSQDNLVERANAGFALQVLSNTLQLAFVSLGDRALHNAAAGMVIAGGQTGQVSVQSGIFAGNGTHGLSFQSPMAGTLRFLTLADNQGVGLMASGFVTAPALDHLLCSQNLQAEVNVPPGTPITFSAFQNQSVPGTGNLTGDPRLIRPFYKLRADSPCIDAGDQGATLPATDYEGDRRSALGRPGPTARPDMGADEFISTGSAHTFGVTGFGAAAFRPEIGTPDTTVRIGQPFRIEIRNAVDFNGVPAGGVVIVMASQEDAASLPADLSGLGAPGSFLFQNLRAVAAAPMVPASGLATATINVPNSAELHGVPVLLQGLLTKPGANAAGVVVTQGLRVTIGQ